ncbi:hypothetical protein BDM02DRAFT_3222827 [Thelephora ganbajun]|uniref:Uncharacterized protein n=1 Tax=Thelephora ganbajun TaxID=370292 RepID=A0ACB6ZL13_THEGA|nr:hypothetical protein BDM02DRAFT_3222827 [Thelephora ganbajun]
MNPRSGNLAKTELFRRKSHLLSREDRIHLSYERARAVARVYDLSAEDILHISSKFWELQTNPIMTMDELMANILTTQLALCAGVLATLADDNPRLKITLQALIDFEISGMFCLTERDHGPNVSNVGTCAVMHPDGSFDLWTPYDGAAKLLPLFFPSSMPSEAIVFARLAVDGEDRGIKPFLVPLHNGSSMSSGITTYPLSSCGVVNPSDHMLACFNHIHLPPTSLLTSRARTTGAHDNYLQLISRAAAHSLSLTAACLPVMQIMSYVVGKYSPGEVTVDPMTGLQRPVIGLRTQYIPVMTAIAHTFTSVVFANHVRAALDDPGYRDDTKNCLVAILRSVVFNHATRDLELLGERYGAHGLLVTDKLDSLLAKVRGLRTTQGDTLEASARLAIDLVLGRIAIPPPRDPASPLAQYAMFLVSELRGLLPHDAELHGDGGFSFLVDTRSEASILPLCVPLVQAIGHRMAYDSAVEASVDPVLVDVYVASAVLLDPAWYSETQDPAIRLSGFDQVKRQVEACTRGIERVDEWLDKLDVEPYIPVAIAGDKQRDDRVESFGAFGGAVGFEDEYEEFTFGDAGDHVGGLDIDTAMVRPAPSIDSLRLRPFSDVAK